LSVQSLAAPTLRWHGPGPARVHCGLAQQCESPRRLNPSSFRQLAFSLQLELKFASIALCRRRAPCPNLDSFPCDPRTSFTYSPFHSDLPTIHRHTRPPLTRWKDTAHAAKGHHRHRSGHRRRRGRHHGALRSHARSGRPHSDRRNVFPSQATRKRPDYCRATRSTPLARIGAAPTTTHFPPMADCCTAKTDWATSNSLRGLAKQSSRRKVLRRSSALPPRKSPSSAGGGPPDQYRPRRAARFRFCSLVGRLVIAGGMSTPWPCSPVADFNMFCDPLSARHVLKSSATKTLIPLDVSSELTFTFEFLPNCRETTRAGKFLRQICVCISRPAASSG